MVAAHGEAVELVRATALSQDLNISTEDAAAAIHYTRDLLTGEVDVERALSILPGGRANPINLDSPKTPAVVLGRPSSVGGHGNALGMR
jgi:hypothetical protein